MDKHNHTIYDIAESAGVSIATVSRVLRGKSTVSEKTRRRVEAVIRSCNYQPSAYARGLSQSHTKTYGIILPKLLNPNYVLLFEGAYDEAAKNGYVMTLFPWENMNKAGLDLVEVLSERRLDGVLICLEFISRREQADWMRKLAALRQYMPVVLLGSMHEPTEYPSVMNNLSECVQMTMKYLSELKHEKIALLGGFDERDIPFSRDEGYRQGLRDARLPYVDDYRVFGFCTVEDGKRQMNTLLNNLKPSQWPTAIIAANDMVAMGAMQAAQERGLRIPEDLSVTGCDDTFYAKSTRPMLTSIQTHQAKIGRRAVQLLLGGESAREIIPCEMVLRESCAVCREARDTEQA